MSEVARGRAVQCCALFGVWSSGLLTGIALQSGSGAIQYGLHWPEPRANEKMVAGSRATLLQTPAPPNEETDLSKRTMFLEPQMTTSTPTVAKTTPTSHANIDMHMDQTPQEINRTNARPIGATLTALAETLLMTNTIHGDRNILRLQDKDDAIVPPANASVPFTAADILAQGVLVRDNTSAVDPAECKFIDTAGVCSPPGGNTGGVSPFRGPACGWTRSKPFAYVCAPNVYLAGFQRVGSTALYSMLMRLPGVCPIDRMAEPHWLVHTTFQLDARHKVYEEYLRQRSRYDPPPAYHPQWILDGSRGYASGQTRIMELISLQGANYPDFRILLKIRRPWLVVWSAMKAHCVHRRIQYDICAESFAAGIQMHTKNVTGQLSPPQVTDDKKHQLVQIASKFVHHEKRSIEALEQIGRFIDPKKVLIVAEEPWPEVHKALQVFFSKRWPYSEAKGHSSGSWQAPNTELERLLAPHWKQTAQVIEKLRFQTVGTLAPKLK